MIYIASPLFSPIEREFNLSLKRSLSLIAPVYLPQEDGDLLSSLLVSDLSLTEAKKKIFLQDLEAIRNSRTLLAVLDGRAIDEGVCVEIGFAFANGINCVGLKTDERTLLRSGDNPMVTGCFSNLFHNLRDTENYMKEYFS